MEEFGRGYLGEKELSPELKLGVGKPLGWDRILWNVTLVLCKLGLDCT